MVAHLSILSHHLGISRMLRIRYLYKLKLNTMRLAILLLILLTTRFGLCQQLDVRRLETKIDSMFKKNNDVLSPGIAVTP